MISRLSGQPRSDLPFLTGRTGKGTSTHCSTASHGCLTGTGADTGTGTDAGTDTGTDTGTDAGTDTDTESGDRINWDQSPQRPVGRLIAWEATLWRVRFPKTEKLQPVPSRPCPPRSLSPLAPLAKTEKLQPVPRSLSLFSVVELATAPMPWWPSSLAPSCWRAGSPSTWTALVRILRRLIGRQADLLEMVAVARAADLGLMSIVFAHA